jgi:hypothetical protein
MRLTIRLSDALAEQVAAARAERGMEMAAMVRNALSAYIAEGSRPAPRPAWAEPTPQMAHTLDDCAAGLVAHWPPELQRRLEEERRRTGLGLRDLVLGVCYTWAKPEEHALTTGPLSPIPRAIEAHDLCSGPPVPGRAPVRGG